MQEIIDLTQKLVRFKTMHSKAHEIDRCAAFIEKYINDLGIDCRRLENGRTPVILVLPKNNIAPVLLMSHIDVVDGPENLFKPVLRNGELYGRGCFDDKYAVALSLVLLKKKMEQLDGQGRGRQDLPFGILITSDEEIGGFNGAKKVLGDLHTDFCIVLDGGSIEKIVVKEKGVARVKLLSRVKTDSNRISWPNKNAVEKLKDDIDAWKTYFVTSVPEHPHRAVVCNRIHITRKNAGVPECAEAHLEIRYTESDNLEQMFNTLPYKLHSDIVLEDVKPLYTGGESEHLKLLLDISTKTRIGFEDGENDARFLSQFGIKGIVWGADGDGSQHTPDEHVNIESVFELFTLLDAFIRQCESMESVCGWSR